MVCSLEFFSRKLPLTLHIIILSIMASLNAGCFLIKNLQLIQPQAKNCKPQTLNAHFQFYNTPRVHI